MQMNSEAVQLDRPGAGLPFPESVLARYVLFPIFCRRHNREKALIKFQDEGRMILNLTESLADEVLFKQVLIRRFTGIEDSSRFWSPAMTLEHLIIVGKAIQSGLVLLSEGKTPPFKADTAAVKPNPVHDRRILTEFLSFIQSFDRTMRTEVKNWESEMRFRHPWFGLMNMHQWVCLAALHQGIHRKQIQRILNTSA